MGRHLLVEKQEIWWVECKVILQAEPGGEVGQAAELGKMGSRSLSVQLGPRPLPQQKVSIFRPTIEAHV